MIALCTHLAMAVLVLQVFTRNNILYLVAAILWHAATDGIAVYAAPTWGAYATEGMLSFFALAALALIFIFRPRGPATTQPMASLPA